MTDLSIRTARDGASVVDLELSNRPGVFAVMDLSDAEAWIAGGLSTAFSTYGNGSGKSYVRYYDARRRAYLPVARVLLPAATRAVRYRDGDTLDLRRRNLWAPVDKGAGRPSKLTVEDRQVILQAREAGTTLRALAARYEVNEATIRHAEVFAMTGSRRGVLPTHNPFVGRCA